MRKAIRSFWKSGRCRLGLLCAMGLAALAAGLFVAGKARAACNFADGQQGEVSIECPGPVCDATVTTVTAFTSPAGVPGIYTWTILTGTATIESPAPETPAIRHPEGGYAGLGIHGDDAVAHHHGPA